MDQESPQEHNTSRKQGSIWSADVIIPREHAPEQKSEPAANDLSSVVSPLRRRVRWAVVLSMPIVAAAILWTPLRPWVFAPLTLLTLSALAWLFNSNLPKTKDPKNWGGWRRRLWCLLGAA